MSVSAFDTSVSVLSHPDNSASHSNADAPTDAMARHFAASTYNSYGGGNVNFSASQTQAGLVFGGAPHATGSRTEKHFAAHHHNHSAFAHPATQAGGIQQFKHWMGNWFGGHRPPAHAHPGGPPARPLPVGAGNPNPIYAKRSDDQLAQSLLDNFKAFTGSKHAKTLDTAAIRNMAQRPLGWNPVTNQNIQLAREILRRPELINGLDRNVGTGALDGRIDKQQLGTVIRDSNAFKYKNDKEVAKEMLDHFNQLKERFGGRQIDINDLKKLASMPLTGNPSKDHFIELGQAVLKRGDLLKKMDNLASQDADGRISKHALQILSR